MDMNDNAMQHMMNTQTQMIQQLTSIANDIKMSTTQSPSFNSSMPQMSQGQGGMSVGDPTAYGSYANPYSDGGRQSQGFGGSMAASMPQIGGMIDGFQGYDRTRTSKDAQSQIAFERSRGFQEAIVDGTIGAAGTGGAAASMFIPGLLPSLAVGGAVGLGVGALSSTVAGGATTALDYQEVLQRSGSQAFNAFQSTDEFGGIGMGIDDRQELSKFFREMAPEKFLDDNEMTDILQGSLDNNLMRTTQDVHQFKDKFEEIVDTVKEITLTMNQTIEEATEFMGEMERLGIQHKDMSQFSAQARVTSSVLGIDADQGSQIILGATENIVQGSTMDAADVGAGVSQMMTHAQQYEDFARDNDEQTYNYMINQGGAMNVGAGIESRLRDFSTSSVGNADLIGAYATMFEYDDDEERFRINRAEMDRLTSGDMTAREMQDQSRNYTTGLTQDQRLQLDRTAPNLVNEQLSSADIARLLDRSVNMRQELSPNDIGYDTLLQELGFSSSYEGAVVDQELLRMTTDREMSAYFQAQSTKEAQDAYAMANNPGLWARTKAGFQSAFGVPIGNIGQGISDGVGGALNDINLQLSGMDGRNMVGGELLPSFDGDGIEEVFGNLDVRREEARETKNYLVGEGEGDWNVLRRERELVPPDFDEASESISEFDQMSRGRYDYLRREIQEGNVSQNEILDILDEEPAGFLEDGILGDWRSQGYQNMLEREVEGAYDGFFGTIQYGLARGTQATLEAGAWAYDKVQSGVEYVTGGPAIDSAFSYLEKEIGGNVDAQKATLEEQGDSLNDVQSNLQDELRGYLSESGVRDRMSGDQLDELEEAIISGDTSSIPDDARDLAKRYSEYNEQVSMFEDRSRDYADVTRFTGAYATMGSQLGSYVGMTGAFTDGELNDIMKDMESESKDVLEDLSDGKMSATDQLEFVFQREDDINSFFSDMTRDGRMLVAEKVAADHQGINYEDLTFEDSEGIDPEKLSSALMEVFRQQHADDPYKGPDGESEVSDELFESTQESNQKVIDAAIAHETAMSEFLVTIQNERGMIEDALNNGTIREARTTSTQTT